MKMTVRCFLLYEEVSREGEYGALLAYIRSDVVPWPLENSSWISFNESSHSQIRRGAVVHYAPPSAMERTLWLYMGSCETYIRLMRRVSSFVRG